MRVNRRTLAMAKAYSDKKGGYTETSTKVLLNGEFEAQEFEDGAYAVWTGILDIRDGDKISVTWNGKQYTCTAFDLDGMCGFGNLSLVGGDDTGEPFLYAPYAEDGVTTAAGFITLDMGNISISVTCVNETVHPIDPKYLPGVCLPMVEISTIPAGVAPVTLTAEESAVLEDLAATKLPIVLQLNGNDVIVTCVSGYTNMFGSDGFLGFLGGASFIVMKDENGAWIMQSQS